MRIRTLIGGAFCAGAAALALVFSGSSLSATGGGCDFLTGGGYIIGPIVPGTTNKGHFAVAGGCKNGLFWGHLNYRDQTANVKVKSIKITGYQIADHPKARLICGIGKTDYGGHVDFVVRAKDAGEPGIYDEFDIQLTGAVGFYSTFLTGPHKLGGGTQGGGNIQLHKPHPNSGDFGGQCPPILPGPPPPPPPPPPPQNIILVVTIDPNAGGEGIVIGGPGINCGHPPLTVGQDCSESFPEGTVVTLTAQGAGGASAQFASPACDFSETTNMGQTQTCTFTVTAETADVQVRFFFPE